MKRCVFRDGELVCGDGGAAAKHSIRVCGVDAALHIAGGAHGYVVEAETRVDQRLVCNADLVGEWVWGGTRYTRWENTKPVAAITCIHAPLRLERTSHIIGCAGASIDAYEKLYAKASALLGPMLYNTYIVLEGLGEAAPGEPYLLAPLTSPDLLPLVLAYSPLIQHMMHRHASSRVVAGELARLIEDESTAIPPWLAKRILSSPVALRRVLDATLISRVELGDGSLKIRAPHGSIIGIRGDDGLVLYMRIHGGEETIAVNKPFGKIIYIVYPADTFIHTG